ncbi:hypothetical protein [Microvirga sp. VF16]|uniref:hypothetical protein n=1 Tax=Microvirga sp. VF16 TaxID=2807101 RepID=UPI00193EB80A|nr:hypothetical protein [Microvirga sp. VF16]QRM28700.1 hypothetical protein JO965_21120 [Microvirga sp. VF16]
MIHSSKHISPHDPPVTQEISPAVPDAALLRLMDEHTKAQARVKAAEIALEAKPARLSEAKFDRLCWKVSDIEDAILAQPSSTPEGLRMKTRIASRYLQAPEDWGGRTYDVFGRFVESILCQTSSGRSGTLPDQRATP